MRIFGACPFRRSCRDVLSDTGDRAEITFSCRGVAPLVSWRVLALNLPTRYISCHTCGFGLSLQAPLDGALRGSPHLCKPIRRLVLRTVVAHPFPAGRCLRLPGRACVRHVRQASASSEGSFVSLRWYCRASHSHVRCFCASVSGPPEGKETGLFPASAYGRRLKARVVPFGRTLLVPLPICSPRPAGADQAV